MPFPPLDDLGHALRERAQEGRHDIDWSQHPLMKCYIDHHRGWIFCPARARNAPGTAGNLGRKRGRA